MATALCSQSIVVIVFLFLVRFCCCSSNSVVPYSLGNFASLPQQKTTPTLVPVRSDNNKVSHLWENCARYFRIGVFLYYTRGAVDSIMDDSWEAVRDPNRVFRKQIRRAEERKVVMRRTRRSETIRALVGAGYTPRLVWLFGLMLRGIVRCTALPRIFEPPIGFGAGAVAAARYAHREWLPVIMLGWYGGGFYWKKIFGVNGPPRNDFNGVPITICRVRL